MELTLSQAQTAPQRSVLQWGPSKAGKTYNLMTLFKALPPGRQRIHVYDFDWGADPLVRQALAAKLPDDAIRVFRYANKRGNKLSETSSPTRTGDNFLTFMNDINKYYDQIDPKTGDWSTPSGPGAIVIDTLTSLQDVLMDFIVSQTGRTTGGDKPLVSVQEYGMLIDKVQEVVEAVKALPAVFILNAHEQIDKDEILGSLRCDPLVVGKKLPSQLASKFGVVLYATSSGDGKNREWITQPTPSMYIKCAGTRHADNLPVRIPQDFKLVL